MEVSDQLYSPAALPPGERTPGTHWIGGWVGLRAGLDVVEERKIFHCGESNPDRAACSSSLYRLSYPDSNYRVYSCDIRVFMLNLIKIL
jgi:hypothetical protein